MLPPDLIKRYREIAEDIKANKKPIGKAPWSSDPKGQKASLASMIIELCKTIEELRSIEL